jgi:hypothetical protein
MAEQGQGGAMLRLARLDCEMHEPLARHVCNARPPRDHEFVSPDSGQREHIAVYCTLPLDHAGEHRIARFRLITPVSTASIRSSGSAEGGTVLNPCDYYWE